MSAAGMIAGTVEGWGRVQVHRYGWRAEKARVTGIYDTSALLDASTKSLILDRLGKITEAYDVPLLPHPWILPSEEEVIFP